MLNSKSEKECLELFVAEVCPSITNESSGHSKSAEDVPSQEAYHNLVVICCSGYGFYTP